MFWPKRVLVGGFLALVLYVAFAATVPNPAPNAPLTTPQKIAKYIKPLVVDKALDKIRDKVVDLAMNEGSKWIGGPFRGGDEDTTRDVLTVVIDPRQWKQAPLKIAGTALKSSQTASQVDDAPGSDPASQSSRLPYQERAAQASSPVCTAMCGYLDDDDFVAPVVAINPQSPNQAERSETGGTFSRPERTASDTSHDPQQTQTSGQQQTLASGQERVESVPKQVDFVRASDGHYYPVAAATPAPAAAPPAPARTMDREPGAGRGGGGPMGGAHEIGAGRDKPDHNTPGGRDTGRVT